MAQRKKTRTVPVPPSLLWAVLLLALAVRLAHLFFSRNSPFFEPLILDPQYYHEWAIRIVGGDWKGENVFYGLPLYPFFLALAYKIFHNSLVAAKLIQVFLGLVTVLFIYKTGEKLHSRAAGLLAALFAALYGPLFFHEQILIPEALSLPLYAAAFYCACLFVDAPTAKKGAALGALCALAALTKAGIVPFVLLFPLVFIRNKARRDFPTKAFASYALAFFLVLSPVAIHNAFYGHDFVPLTPHGGFNFYIGNNPAAEGVFSAPAGTGTNVDAQKEDSRAVAEREVGKPLKPSEVSAYWSRKAWAYIRGNPFDFLRLCLRKLVLFFDAREISDVEDYAFAKNFNPLLRLPWLDFSLLGPLAVLGLCVSFGKIRYRTAFYMWVVSYTAAVVLFFINARYRLPMLGVFLPAAAVGAVEIYGVIRQRSWVRLFLYAAILAAGVWLVQARLVGTNWLKDNVNAGDAYVEKKDYEHAGAFYERALKIDPDSSKANLAMGVLMTRLNRDDEAKVYYEKCLAIEPRDAQALNNLGLWYEKQGDLGQAEDYFLRAVDAKPNSSQAYNNLGMVYGNMRRYEKASEALRKSLSLNPSSPRANTNLGLVYYRLGDKESARKYWRRALEVDPAFEDARRALRLLGD